MKAIKTSIATSGLTLCLKAILVGLISASAVIGVLLGVSSLLLLAAKTIPYDILPWIMIVLCAFGTFAGGFVTGSITKSQGLIWGGAVGILVAIAMILAGIGASSDTLGLVTLVKLAALTLAGSLGGIMAVNKKDKIRIK